MDASDELVLVNALSKEHDRMRPGLIPGMLQALSLNAKTYASCRFFELGRVYKPDGKNFSREFDQLAIVYYSREKTPFMELVNTAEKLFGYANLPACLMPENPKANYNHHLFRENWKGLHPFEYYNIKLMGKMDGALFSLHPLILKNFKDNRSCFHAMLMDLASLEKATLKERSPNYKPLAKFPSSRFDYCLEVDRNLPVAQILDCLKTIKIKELVSHQVVDVFLKDKDKKFLTMRSTFLDEQKTLSGDFIKNAENTIIQTLNDNGYFLREG